MHEIKSLLSPVKSVLTLLACAVLLIIAVVWMIIDPHNVSLAVCGVGIAISQMSLKEVREYAAKLVKKMEELRDAFQRRLKEGKTGKDLWPDDSRALWDQTNGEYEQCEQRIEALNQEADIVRQSTEAREWLERSSRSRPDLNTPAGPGDQRTLGDLGLGDRDEAAAYQQNCRDRNLAFQAWALTEIADHLISDAHREACQRLHFNPACRQLQLQLLSTEEFRFVQQSLAGIMHDRYRREQMVRDIITGRAGQLESRAMTGTTGATGGFLVAPMTLVRAIEVAMVQFGAILQVAETITTETGEPIGWPYVDDTSNSGAYADENVDLTGDGEPNPVVERVMWGAYDIHSKFIKVPLKLSRDSVIDIDLLVGRLIGERIGRKLSTEATTGEARIRGIVPRSAVGQTAAASTSITYDDTVGLETALDAGWEPEAGYMFHKNVLKELRLLKDGESRPLWVQNIAAGAPPTFNGKPYTTNADMASSVASAAKTMIFGKLSEYKIRRVGTSLTVLRLVERFAEYLQTGYLGHMAADGNLLRPANTSACPVLHLLQP
jgi:HK97 family phage major capsid protein